MPIFEIQCAECRYTGEVLVMSGDGKLSCPQCGSRQTSKMMSAISSLTGREGMDLPGRHDTACCGQTPGHAGGCAGPGSCCGKNG